MVACRYFLAYMQMLELTLFKPCSVDFVITSCHITPGTLLINLVCYSLAGLLVPVSLPRGSQCTSTVPLERHVLSKDPRLWDWV